MGDHARLVASMRLAMELAASSRFFAKLSDLFASDAAFGEALARVRGSSTERLRVVAYGLGGAEYSWAPRFRLAVLLLLRDAFPETVGTVEVVCPTASPVERRAMEDLGCVVTASVQQCRPVRDPTLIFTPYADRVFFENLLTLNWSADQLGKIVLLGLSFSAMVKMLELNMSKQEKFGVTEQRKYLSVIFMEVESDVFGAGNDSMRVWSTVNVQMNYDAQLVGWHLNPTDAYIEGKDIKEAASIVKEVRETMRDVKSSSLYTKFIDQLNENPSIGDHISSILEANECMGLVIYGIGSFEFNVNSQYQLAFALLLKEDKVFPVGDIEIYDPALSPADVKACFDLGVRVLLVNEQCQRSVEKPTLFYLEVLEVDDAMDIYSKLPRLTLKEKFYRNFELELEYVSYLAFDHVASLLMQSEERISRPFREDHCDHKDDGTPFWGDVFRHRLPAMKRMTWSPPPKGWIKLNFHGIGCSKGRPACIGGILHDDKGEVLSYYAGQVGKVDKTVASALALEMGLQKMIDLHEPVFKLIIEGDNLAVIRWCNRISHPPERAFESFSRSYWYMDLRQTEAPAPDDQPGKCNEETGEDKDGGSKDGDVDDGSSDKEDEDGSSPSSDLEFVIPPGWAQREYIAWHVEEANRVTIRLARVGVHLPGVILHQSTMCDCGNGMDMENDKSDVTWFLHGFDEDDDIVKKIKQVKI
ncbi:hypothetical protein HU200_033012 [Digitaria exilis]|uniref:SRR1-like domain-containing protein n=1 Tax=Digitaria exilis TaxID=1010633 RepID=A0A835ENT6_9POAL|nr:hypothetical protein HU200_033012 [Digitaria exilis]